MKLRPIRFGIKAQLSLFVCVAAMFSLGVLSVATYISNRNLVLDLREEKLMVIAQMKAAQVQQAIGSLVGQTILLTSRSFVQNLLATFYTAGSIAEDDSNLIQARLAVEATDYVLAVNLYSLDLKLVVSIQSPDMLENETLPESLFPTTFETSAYLSNVTSQLECFLVGPERVNDRYAMSFTRLVTENNPEFDYHVIIGSQALASAGKGNSIGYLTVVTRAKPVLGVIRDPDGLEDGGSMGLVELVGDDVNAKVLEGRYVLPTTSCGSCYNRTFPLLSFEVAALVGHQSGSFIDAQVGDSSKASGGFAPVTVLNRDWAAFIYQSHGEVYKPLYRIRNMLLIALFSIGAGMFIGTLFLSSWAVKPITRLQSATEQSTQHDLSPGGTSKRSGGPMKRWFQLLMQHSTDGNSMMPLFRRPGVERQQSISAASTGFRIPDKVSTRSHVKDELTDLTEKFNEMTDELRKQYSILEERVEQRTVEIENARVVAESANEAKSLFIAKITHELRTPLNGILGMTAVSMDEEDPKKIQESLKIIFKSGELLLHLLTDLLTFSKNQVGHLDLEEKEFMITEALTQLNAVFGEQSRTAQVNLSIECITEELREVVLYGDMNRILQIIINLVSNSLKFTLPGGSVRVVVSGIISDHILASLAAESQSPLQDLVGDVGGQQLSNENKSNDSTKRGSTTTKDSVTTAASGISLTDSTHFYDESDPEKKEDSWSSESDTDVITVVFKVSDTGPGIAPHLQGRIFEAFVQGDVAQSQRQVGVGLGLSICRQLATLMHGTVELESELGRGSTFIFKVPLRVVKDGTRYIFADLSTVQDWPEYDAYNFDTIERRAEEEVEDVNSRAMRTSSQSNSDVISTLGPLTPLAGPAEVKPSITMELPKRELRRPPMSRSASHKSREEDRKFNFPVSILIAEDNKVNQEVMIRMLKLEGIENVTVANDGLEAVEHVRASMKANQLYDVVFMDVQMPNLDGREATKLIRSHLGFTGPIVGVSAFADSSNIDDCLAVGMNHFLAKPLRRPHLHRLLLSMLFNSP